MKVLVAAGGETLDSPVARRFGMGAKYLVVDLENLRLDVIRGFELKDHRSVIEKALEWGAGAIIVGNAGPRMFELLSSSDLPVALAVGMSVREAVERYLRGALRVLDALELRRGVEEHEAMMRGRRRPWEGEGRHGMFGGAGAVLRGRHHLQQYGGRGH